MALFGFGKKKDKQPKEKKAKSKKGKNDFRSKSKPVDLSPEEAMNQGRQFMEAGQHAEAIQAFDRVLQSETENGEALFCKGIAFAEVGQTAQAIDAYKMAAEFAGDRACLPLYNLGNLYQEQGDLEQAAKCFHQATRVEPGMTDAWINLGRVLDDSGSHEMAVECYDVALKMEPQDVTALANRGNSLSSISRNDEAMASYDQALALDPANHAAQLGKGMCMANIGDSSGFEQLNNLYEKSGDSRVLFEKATLLAQMDKPQEAIGDFEKLAEANYDHPAMWNNRAEVLASLERFDESIESFDKALKKDADYPGALFGKARVLITMHRLEEARPLVQQYLQIAKPADRAKPATQAMASLCGFAEELNVDGKWN